MTVIKIDGTELVVNLTWMALLGIGSEPNEIKKFGEDHDARYGTVVRTDDLTVVGITDAMYPKAKCGAAWLAGAAVQTEILVLVEPVSDTQSWFCAIQHSAPMPEFDVVLDNREIEERLNVLRIGDRQAILRVVSRDGFVDGSSAGTFNELVAGIKPVKIVQLYGTPKNTVYAAGALVAILAIGLAGKTYVDITERTASKQRLASRNAKQMRASAEEIERMRVETLAAAEKEVRTKVINAGAMGASVDAWFATFESIPIYAVGWRLSKVDCQADVCHASWARTKGSTVDAFTAVAREKGWEPEIVSGDLARVTLKPLTLNRAGDLNGIPVAGDFMNHFVSQMQKLETANVRFEIKRAEPVKVMLASPPGTPAGTPPTTPPVIIPWKVGQFNLIGKYLFELREMHGYIDFRNVALTSFSIDVDKSAWSAIGNYAIR